MVESLLSVIDSENLRVVKGFMWCVSVVSLSGGVPYDWTPASMLRPVNSYVGPVERSSRMATAHINSSRVIKEIAGHTFQNRQIEGAIN